MENEYQVEEIIGRKVYSGKVLYLVKWKGFPISQSSWESIKVLKSVKHFVKEYNDKHKHNDNLDEDKEIKPVIKGRRGRPRKNAVKQRENIKTLQKQPQPELFFDSEEEKKNKSTKNRSSKQEQKLVIQSNIVHFQDSFETKSKATSIDTKSQPIQQIDPFKPNLPQQSNFSPILKSTMTTFAAVTKSKEQPVTLKKIYFIEKTQDQKIQYLVEYSNGNLVKCLSEQLVEKYPNQLIKFLEDSLVSKLK